ncbi:thiamine diphosphokinase [Patescibacteria group bacterium]|nr:thiamine diphosphokinase [Patescibacteria group bacterium]MBU1472212.1 thiamine diphosphokinase [Patescibacteria group bacterium]MBU2459606.1 thiamine diphosphokinase [Patescibacteria group bacterium]MBU2544526.1 thiamine diphosphokinase [Patescibacteria group bacterium]
MINKLAIVAGGKLSKKFLPEMKRADYSIGVDHGAYWLIKNNIRPDVSLGDFDSVTEEELRCIKQQSKKIIVCAKEKNETDLEIAVGEAMSIHPQKVVIYGATGVRLDHTIAAVNLLGKFLANKIPAKIVDEHNEISLMNTKQILPKGKHKYFSIFAYTKKAVVTLKQFKYPVSQKTFFRESSLGVSNEIQSQKGEVIIHSGKVLVIKSKD